MCPKPHDEMDIADITDTGLSGTSYTFINFNNIPNTFLKKIKKNYVIIHFVNDQEINSFSQVFKVGPHTESSSTTCSSGDLSACV